MQVPGVDTMSGMVLSTTRNQILTMNMTRSDAASHHHSTDLCFVLLIQYSLTLFHSLSLSLSLVWPQEEEISS